MPDIYFYTLLTEDKVPLGGEEVHILNLYLEPGHESFVVKRAETVISLVKNILGLVHLEVFHEDCKILPMKLI